MSEAGHWYDKKGELILSVPYADKKREGETRSTTLRDAKKLSLRPSVTTLLSLLAKPALTNWLVEQAVKTALATKASWNADADIRNGELQKEQISLIIQQSHDIANAAAEFGTAVHYGISVGLSSKQEKHVDVGPAPNNIVKNFWSWYIESGLNVIRSEHSFVSKLGFAGTIDVQGTWNGKPCIADFKTQDFSEEKGVNGPKFYDEHALQLSGYAIGTEQLDVQRLSVVISRTTPGLVVTHLWDDDGADSIAHWDKTFLALWELWKLLKRYDPIAIN